MPKAKPDANAITVETAAQLLMLSTERVRQLAKDGWIERKGNGRYDLVSVVQGYIRFLKDEGRRTSRSAAESRVRDARAREIELRVAEREHRLIDIDEHDAVLDEVLGIVRAELSGAPARITRDLPLRRSIEAELNAVLQRAADRCAERSSELRKSGEAAHADPEDVA